MSVKLSDLAAWIDQALTKKPSPRLTDICGDYYSPYYMFLGLAADELEDQGLAVELGTEGGRGLASMTLGPDVMTEYVRLASKGFRQEGTIIGIDHTRSEELSKVLEKFGSIQFFHRDSLPVAGALLTCSNKIALLHIDTEHSYSMAKAEFEAYRPLLTSPAVVVFDDLHAQDDDVLRYFVSLPYPKIIDDRMHPSCGWGVLLYEAGYEH